MNREDVVLLSRKVKRVFSDILSTRRLSVTTGKGHSTYIRLSTWGSDKEIPNNCRKIIINAVYGDDHNVLNLSDINYGNIQKFSVAISPEEWVKVLEDLENKHYGILK